MGSRVPPPGVSPQGAKKLLKDELPKELIEQGPLRNKLREEEPLGEM